MLKCGSRSKLITIKGGQSMQRENVIYGVLCGIGGGMIGLFANRLNTIWGAALFTLGICILVFSIIKLDKK